MSYKNRKKVYEFLVERNRQHHISERLIAEFGKPPAKPKKKVPPLECEEALKKKGSK
jgi:hypothetical protein|tara:strand:- start:1031 stop:1201 length:171 start_codon:yes stop_codon:yes gene_type:complete